jgi:hypothetical protein
MGWLGMTATSIAKLLGTEVARLSPRRAELISKGLIFAPQRGLVSFTVPMMANFIKRQGD